MNYIWITTQFEGFHYYPDAPQEVSFLRYEHRHTFHVKVLIEILKDLNRELEFFMVKRQIDKFLNEHFKSRVFSKSCEMIANDILDYCIDLYPNRKIEVDVSEDGGNGGGVIYDPK